jgi:hypothetical protein
MFFPVVLGLSAIVFILGIYLGMLGLSTTGNGSSSGLTTRVALLAGALGAVNIWNYPVKPFFIEGRRIVPPYLLYVFSYVILGIVSLFIIFSGEPAYAFISICIVMYIQSVNIRFNCKYPNAVPVMLTIITLLFFTDRTEIISMCNWFRDLFNFELSDAMSIRSYIISPETIFNQPIILASIIGITSFLLMKHSCSYYSNYMIKPDLPLEVVLDPNSNGQENISRFIGDLKSS